MSPDERKELAIELREAADQVDMLADGEDKYWAQLMRLAAMALERESKEREMAVQRIDTAMASIKPLIDHLVDL